MSVLALAARALSRILSMLAVVALGFMMLVTVADIVLRSIHPDWRIFGMLDYVEFSLDWLIFLAIPLAILEGRMIVVDIVDSVAGPVVRRALRGCALLLMLAAFAVLATEVVPRALEIREWGETTLDLRLPKFWYWVAIWVGIASAIAATLLSAPAELTANSADSADPTQ